jgi:hypothetical protein
MNHYLFDKYKETLLSKFGVVEKSFEEGLIFWIQEYGDTEKTRSDFVWSVFNLILENIGETFKSEEDLYSRQRGLYLEMWHFLIDEKRDFYHIKKQLLFCDLKIQEHSDWESEVFLIANKCCPECGKGDTLSMLLREAIIEQPLPNPKCTRKTGCTCCYGFRGLRDGNGRLIRKQK